MNALSYVTSMNYDAAGNPISTQDANGFFTTSVYSPTSNRKVATIDALNYATTMLYDLASQNIGRQNEVGNWITMSYDLAGRQLAIFNRTWLRGDEFL